MRRKGEVEATSSVDGQSSCVGRNWLVARVNEAVLQQRWTRTKQRREDQKSRQGTRLAEKKQTKARGGSEEAPAH